MEPFKVRKFDELYLARWSKHSYRRILHEGAMMLAISYYGVGMVSDRSDGK